MVAKEPRDRSNYVRFDPEKVKYYLYQQEVTPVMVQTKAVISADVWERIMHGKEIKLESAVKLRKFLHLPDLFCIMDSTMLAQFTGMLSIGPTGSVLPDWEAVEPLSGELKASNGIKYTLWKLSHCVEKNRFARGKRYDLSTLPTVQFNGMREYLVRHGEICNRLRGHPRIPEHYTTTPAPRGGIWWVVDEWTPGRTMEEALGPQSPPLQNVPRIMREIAEGLKTLHDAEIIRRELSPRFIILRKSDDAVMFTDFELGKLLDGSPTVKTKFPCDPYRAPEGGGELAFADRNVDLYSWGRICVHAVLGREPPKPGKEEPELKTVKLPSEVRKIILRCVSLKPEKRPQNVEEVQDALRGW